MTTQLSSQDLSLLQQLRLERLQTLFAKSLGICLLEFEDTETLAIHCPEPWVVDRLMDNMNRLLKAIWIVVGVRYIAICFAGEEVHRAKTRTIRLNPLQSN
jgi:hypothetical protein